MEPIFPKESLNGGAHHFCTTAWASGLVFVGGSFWVVGGSFFGSSLVEKSTIGYSLGGGVQMSLF